ncbi:unnamed protein product, partial [Adineta ricciae]
ELVIKPSDTSLTRDQYKSFIALCTGESTDRIIAWRSPQHKDVSENDNERIIAERQMNGLRLRIRNLTTDDQGVWECVGTDVNGQAMQRSFQMIVKVPAIFHAEPVQYIALGEAATIKCHVQASPVAEISWFKGPEKLRIESPKYEVVTNGLRINRVNMSDNDTFWCRADVLETGESRDYPITVVVSKLISQARVTCANPCAIEKKTATLTCEASGLPEPKYLWFYGSKEEYRLIKEKAVSASEVPKLVVRGNQLTINYVDEADNGKYSCQAFNEFDRKGQRAEYNLNVIVPPRLSMIPPMEINYDPQHAQRVSFQCRMERGSVDGLTMEWQYLNNTPVQSTNDISIDKTQLETNKLIELNFNPVQREHFGNYSCVAKNLADSTYSIASILIKFQPIYVGPNINVISTIPNYRTIIRCLFESYPAPQIQWIKLSRTVQDPEGRILASDIDNGVNDITTRQLGSTLFESVLSYTATERDFGLSFECRALNPRIGRHSFTLQRAKPPKKVNITEVKPSSTGAEIFIQSVEMGDLPIVQYILKYDLEDAKDSQLQTLMVPAQVSSKQIIKIDNLQPNTDYNLIVVAESQAGVGQPTGPIQFRTLDKQIADFTVDENANRTCSNDDSCAITWNIQSNGGAPIFRVEILYAQAKDKQSLDYEEPLSLPISIEAPITEYQLTRLKADTSYIVIVKLYNEAGVAERKFRIKTNRENNRENGQRKESIISDYHKTQPSKWAIIGIIFAIVLAAITIATICIVLRVCRFDGIHKTTNSDHQTTPMMNGEHHSEKTNSHSSTTKHRRPESTSFRLFPDEDFL